MAVALAAVSGCFGANAVVCDDGTVCPVPKVCAPAGGACVDPGQISVCENKSEGDACVFPGVGQGACRDGVCIVEACGDSIISPGETCDDGNTTSGDGCRSDCQKIETCGDAVQDENEACDDGNTNPSDGCDACAATAWTATVTIGGGSDSVKLGLHGPRGVAVDRLGNLYISDTEGQRIRRLDTSGAVTLLAGNGLESIEGDGGPATSAAMAYPWGITTDALGHVYIADALSNRIRRVDGAGTITTVAGTGEFDYSGDGGLATSAALRQPLGVAVDGLGDLYIADSKNSSIRKVTANGVISTVGTPGQFAEPQGVTIDAAGNLFVAATPVHVVYRIDKNGTVSLVAGEIGVSGGDGDNGIATSAHLDSPSGVSVDAAGNLYIADRGNQRIRRIDSAGTITTVAGVGTKGFAGDNGPALAAKLDTPWDVAVDLAGNLYIADTGNNRVRKVAPNGTITTLVGNGSYGGATDGDAPTSTPLQDATGVLVDGQGNVYMSEGSGHRVLSIDAAGLLHVVAGTGKLGAAGDGGPARAAMMWQPAGLARDAFGNIYVAELQNCRIRRITPAGAISTVAGDGTCGFEGDDGMAVDAQLAYPLDVAVDSNGNLYIADSGNGRIRMVATDGTITTFAGGGASFGDNGPAIDAQLNNPSGVTVDANGVVYIADRDNMRIRKVTGGTITTIAGDGTPGYGGDGDDATLAQLTYPFDVAVDTSGVVYIADTYNHRIRRVDAAGDITTIAGDGIQAFDGDGGVATAASLHQPKRIALDSAGNVYVADTGNTRIRKFSIGGTITTIAGLVDPEGSGPLARARLADPRALARTPMATLFAGGSSGVVQALGNAASSLAVVAGRYPQLTAIGARARYRDYSFGAIEGIAYDPATATVYITNATSNRVHAIAFVDPASPPTWTISDFANVAGTAGFVDGPIATARFRMPTGLHLDGVAHRLYVADSGNHLVRSIDLSTSTIQTLAGVPATRGYFGDGGAATSALLYEPHAITTCPNGDLFIADTGNHRVRRIAYGGTTITTVLGDGVAASSGEGAPSSSFPVDAPRGLACDTLGNLFVTSTTTVRLLAASAAGVVDGTGSVETIYGLPPRDEFPASVTRCLTGALVVDDATVQVTDGCTGIAIELRRQKVMP